MDFSRMEESKSQSTPDPGTPGGGQSEGAEEEVGRGPHDSTPAEPERNGTEAVPYRSALGA